MTAARNADLDNVSDFVFDHILLESERLPGPVDIKPIYTDLVIYEHIELPYLTAKLVIVENSRLIQEVDILGGERISISLRSLIGGSLSIEKTFYISKILNNIKTDDHTEVVHFHLVEDICYISNLKNVNKFYRGSGSDIIEKISNNFLSKEIAKGSSDNKQLDLIVPNLDPIHAITWVKNRMSTIEGYPFYLFSTLFGNKLGLADLGTLLEADTVNTIPYRGFESPSASLTQGVSSRVINDFKFQESEDLYTLISQGLIGGEYQYYNTLSDQKNQFVFDVVKDLLQPLSSSNKLGNQKNVTVTPQYELDGKPFNEMKSRSITRIGGSGAYRTADSYRTSYDENINTSDYKRFVISKAMSEILLKSPLTIAVEGLPFISSGGHSTIGNNLRVEFLNSLIDAPESRIDTKKSGNYLIYSADHIFKREKYDLVMTGVKMGNLTRV
jgi:hypothetical protein